ncbi:glycosyltransferase [Thalassotalea euphylliae]|uniref:Glycosyltransferase n=1 Tax=Thalassotalea euphylliae TaxID=1655234 RepID=A0A3E0TMD6_9GAMM|nr:glycosyltransferase family 4 protein [Thalassotalea euphylliae]REL25205.1 glycosyltransferase [Thalassotalea euphylliae]
MSKRVGLISYPMLFQKKGGLQIQVLETLNALKELSVDASLVNVLTDDLADFDILHVFSSNHGNANIITTAKDKGCKVVISPLAEDKWNAKYSTRSRLIEPLLKKFTGYLNYSFFSRLYDAMQLCDHFVALGQAEKTALNQAFDINNDDITIIPNGIPQRFFDASPDYFRQETGIEGDFVLNIASIDRRKNQLALAQAMKEYLPDAKLVLIGPVLKSNEAYLKQIEAVGNVAYLGSFDYQSDMLPSAYAAASVFSLPSIQEVLPLSALESMAAGTPAIVTKVSSMEFPCKNHEFALVDPENHADIASTIEKATLQPPTKASCQNMVRHLTWHAVANQLIEIYENI